MTYSTRLGVSILSDSPTTRGGELLHTEVVESAVREVLRSQAGSPEFSQMADYYRGWANDGGVRVTDDELRGALTALALLWRRASAWGLGTKFLEMLGECGAFLTTINRSRELTADEEADILRYLEAMADDNEKEDGK